MIFRERWFLGYSPLRPEPLFGLDPEDEPLLLLLPRSTPPPLFELLRPGLSKERLGLSNDLEGASFAPELSLREGAVRSRSTGAGRGRSFFAGAWLSGLVGRSNGRKLFLSRGLV